MPFFSHRAANRWPYFTFSSVKLNVKFCKVVHCTTAPVSWYKCTIVHLYYSLSLSSSYLHPSTAAATLSRGLQQFLTESFLRASHQALTNFRFFLNPSTADGRMSRGLQQFLTENLMRAFSPNSQIPLIKFSGPLSQPLAACQPFVTNLN